MNTYSIGKFAAEIGVTVESVRNWDRTGKLKPAFRNPSGHRYYTQEQVDLYLSLHKPDHPSRHHVVGYCRVSSSKEKDDLDKQVDRMKAYLTAQGKPYTVITDIGNGVTYDKKGLNELIDLVLSHKVEKVVVLSKDRLVGFGYELLANVLEKRGVSIEIIDHSARTDNDELMADLTHILTVFSTLLHGDTADNVREMITTLTSEAVDNTC